MSILDKILRRKDTASFERPSYKPLAGDDLGLPEMDNPSSLPELEQDDFSPSVSPLRSPMSGGPRSFSSPRESPRFGNTMASDPRENRDAELILSKLDTIISLIKNLDFRVSRLEKVAGVEEKHDKYRW